MDIVNRPDLLDLGRGRDSHEPPSEGSKTTGLALLTACKWSAVAGPGADGSAVVNLGEVGLVRTTPPRPYSRTFQSKGEWLTHYGSDAIMCTNIDNGFSS